MSSHIHLVLVAGNEPLSAITRSTHGRFARWLNRTEGRLGPVFAARPKCARVNHRVARVIEYVHNNPVRAGVVSRAIESDWTSHSAYVGSIEPPPWLARDLGLAAAGFGCDPAARRAFASAVEDAASQPRDPDLSLSDADEARAAIRSATGGPVELGTPSFEDLRLEWPILAREGHAQLRPRWRGDLTRVVSLTARAMGLVTWRARDPVTVAARRLAVRVACLELNRSLTEASAALGVSLSRASELLTEARADAALEPHARILANALAA
jgi:hypothetical protein